MIKTQVFDSTRMKHEQIKQQPPVKMKGQVKHKMQERGGARRVMRDRVYVSGIPREVQEEEIANLFSNFGRVVNIFMPPVPRDHQVTDKEDLLNMFFHCYLTGLAALRLRDVLGGEGGGQAAGQDPVRGDEPRAPEPTSPRGSCSG